MSQPTPAPELSRIVRFDEIGRIEWPAHIEASEQECTALAQRFGFASLASLTADYSMERNGSSIMATGSIHATLTQSCIATGEPVSEQIDEAFSICFVPQAELEASAPDEEIELDVEEADIIAYSDGRIDMGETIAETLALTVNPYPRSDSADIYLSEAGVLSEEQAGPFAALAALKEKSAK